MCIFTDDMLNVGNTRIFARVDGHGSQCIVYQMNINADREVAMVLPVPLASGGRFQFVDLSGYPEFFADVERLFLPPTDGELLDGADDEEALAVESVGDFDASLVPSRADFGKLDKRFRLDDKVWSALPDYSAFAFAVFKLKPGKKSVHPMAFKFRSLTRDVFFPTLHVHQGGRVDAKAKFDHHLYAHWSDARAVPTDFWVSRSKAGRAIVVDKTLGLVSNKPLYRCTMTGTFKNQDTWIRA